MEINLCLHCSTQCGGKYCPQCSTAQGRRDMDEANRLHFETNHLPPYECAGCKRIESLRKKGFINKEEVEK